MELLPLTASFLPSIQQRGPCLQGWLLGESVSACPGLVLDWCLVQLAKYLNS